MAEARTITPPRGVAGQKAHIHGEGLGQGSFKVTFGQYTPVTEVSPKNDKMLEITIPEKDPRDPDPCPVKVELNEKVISVDGLVFDYRVNEPAPALDATAPFDPPKGVQGQPLALKVKGSAFTNQQGRTPQKGRLVNAGVDIVGTVSDITETSIKVTFPQLDTPQQLTFLGYFSDGTGIYGDYEVQ